MNRLKTIVAMVMLALWLPATNHCRLEQVPALAFLVCCDHEDTAPHQDDDCESDGCALLEDGLYRIQVNDFKIASPHLLPLVVSIPLLEESPDLRISNRGRPTTAPPELPSSWQFSFRAAAPPRAPSQAS